MIPLLTHQQQDVLKFVDYADGPVAVVDLVDGEMTWPAAQRVVGWLSRRGLVRSVDVAGDTLARVEITGAGRILVMSLAQLCGVA